MSHIKKLDLIIWGATGFTGQLVSQYIDKTYSSTNLKWGIAGRNKEKLETVQKEIKSSNGNASFYVCDIREEDKVRQCTKEIYEEFNIIHGLVNNAGGQFPSPAEYISQKGFETVVRTNLVGGFLFSREVFSQGMINSGGNIVNITADMWNGMPGMSHSGAARSGMDNLTKTLAYEWGYAGVRVNSVAPGYIASSGLDTYDDLSLIHI